MVAAARLEGLKIYERRGKWYVYRRATGEALIKAFSGDRAALDKELASPAFLQLYNKARLPKRTAAAFADGTLGRLVHWFTNGDIDREPKAIDPAGSIEGGFPKWSKLSTATRGDYLKAFRWLRDVFDEPLTGFTTPELYELRDKCAHQKKTRFADKMISAVSSMFSSAVERGRMGNNPCLGMRKIHDTDPNANREWLPAEFEAAFAAAPAEIKTVLVLARFGGLRGQTLVEVSWRQYLPHATTGMAVQLVTRKNQEPTFIPALEQMQAYLGTLPRTSTRIATREDGTPWNSEKLMQAVVSRWLREKEREGLIGAGTTVHGLRVSYAAWWKRNGATDAEIADLLGDKSQRMGTHYTRHVAREDNAVRAFKRLKDKS
ncbi:MULTISPECIES: tyrosine-type recombinase/integrase [unclassified Bradyrhizobium]|uniref:tyrosine-type recombinase/integrase n=1 Tax=unclassified Bradyrhizobium TaxID=2631580 RepID=UPI00291607C1|nr:MULTISPECIES: tyrosine-type recombinase/integrase [unclassified Bradyrhizobium]